MLNELRIHAARIYCILDCIGNVNSVGNDGLCYKNGQEHPIIEKMTDFQANRIGFTWVLDY